ncbi:MAG: efflux RND transporter periplasmic adaptor subunit, partial [Phascolarctobacterium sp.]|nr:efflux RND transporter periplasmic adaptor subunit [Candidatus Phascolarctobacterium caballi]
IIIFVVLSILGYGFYLNYTNEKNIALNFASQKVSFVAVRSQMEEIALRWVKYPVKLYAPKHADVVSRNAGILSKVYVEQGQKVKAGQLLALVVSEEIDSKLTEIDAELARTKTLREKYRLTYERYGKLKDSGAVSLEQYDTAKAEYLGTVEQVRAMMAQKEQYELMRDRLSLRAPFDGEVKFVYKKETSYLAPGTPVMLVGDFSTLYFYDDSCWQENIVQQEPLDQEFRLSISYNELQKVFKSKHSPGNDFYTTLGLNNLIDDDDSEDYRKSYKVKIVKIEPPLSEEAEKRIVTYAVDNSEGDLEPRTYQDMVFRGTVSTKEVVVPSWALGDDLTAVMVLGKDGVVEKRQVVAGTVDEGNVKGGRQRIAIKEGLKAGELVLCEYDASLEGKKNVMFTVKEW